MAMKVDSGQYQKISLLKAYRNFLLIFATVFSPWVFSLSSPSLSSQIYVNNHGTQLTGRYHTGIQINADSLLTEQDSLLAEYSHYLNPSNGHEAVMTYHVGQSAQSSGQEGLHQYGVMLESDASHYHSLGQEKSSRYREIKLFAQRCLICGVNQTASANIALASIRSKSATGGKATREDALTQIEAKLDWQDRANKRFHYALELGLIQGIRGFLGSMDAYHADKDVPPSQGGSGQYAKSNYSVIHGGASTVWEMRHGNSIIWRVQGQYSDDFLPLVEQYDLGGSSMLRAYDSDYAGESALETAVDGKIALWKAEQSLQLSGLLFIEAGKLWLADPTATELTQKADGIALYDVGFGLLAQSENQWYGRLQIAYPLGGSPHPLDGKYPRILFSLKYSLV